MPRRTRSRFKRFTGALPQFSGPEARRYLVAVAWVLAAGGMIAAWVIGVPRLEAYASGLGDGQIEIRWR